PVAWSSIAKYQTISTPTRSLPVGASTRTASLSPACARAGATPSNAVTAATANAVIARRCQDACDGADDRPCTRSHIMGALPVSTCHCPLRGDRSPFATPAIAVYAFSLHDFETIGILSAEAAPPLSLSPRRSRIAGSGRTFRPPWG